MPAEMGNPAFEYDVDAKPNDVKPKDKVGDEPSGEPRASPKDNSEIDGIEEKARSDGWRPKEEWQGDPEEWVDAREFNFRGSLMKRIQSQTSRISSQKDDIEQLKKAIKTLGEHNKKIAEQAKKDALNELRREQRAAEREGDTDVADQIADKIQEIRDSTTELNLDIGDSPNLDTGNIESQRAEIFQDWFDDGNDWYQNDPVLRGAFNGIGDDLIAKNPDMDFRKALNETKKLLVKEFPSKFGKKEAPPLNPDSGRPKGRSNKSKYTMNDLTLEEQGVVKRMVGAGAFDSEQEYIDQMAAIGSLEVQQTRGGM